MHSLLIWGASGHARVVADIVLLNNEFELAGFVDDTASAADRFLGLPVYHGLGALRSLHNTEVTNVIVAIGNCAARIRIAETAASAGFHIVSAIHPKAIVASGVSIGEGTVIAAGAVINSGCVVGSNVIVNTGATIDHDSRIADGVHISPGVHLGGSVTVGAGSWLGIGAVVKDKVSIGAGTIVGAGAVVLSDLPDRVKAWGSPARVMKRIGD